MYNLEMIVTWILYSKTIDYDNRTNYVMYLVFVKLVYMTDMDVKRIFT